MKKIVVRPKGNKKPVKAATTSFNSGVARQIQHHLKEALELLVSLDDNSYNDLDGDALSEDLDIYIRQIETEVATYRNLIRNM